MSTRGAPQTISRARPDDWHLHLRDGDGLRAVAPASAAQFARAIVMPNLVPPVTTVAQAEAYRERILAALPAPARPFQPLMTLYLTDVTPAEEIARANEDLTETIRIRRFVLLHKQFDPDDDEITRTRKVRRNVIADRYGDIISALQQGADHVDISSRVTYQDGTSIERELTLRIFDLTTYSIPEGRGRRPVWSGRR